MSQIRGSISVTGPIIFWVQSGRSKVCRNLTNKVAVQPKPIERQNVSTCLRVFCDETIAALRVHPGLNSEEVEGMVPF